MIKRVTIRSDGLHVREKGLPAASFIPKNVAALWACFPLP